MRKLRTATLTAIISLFAASITSAESVRIVSSLENISASFDIHDDASGVSLNLSIPAVAVTSCVLNAEEYKKVSLPSCQGLELAETAEDGLPDVPALTSMIIIPDQAGVTLSVTYSSFDEIEGFDIAPTQPSPEERPDAPPIPFTINDKAYSQDSFYPGQIAEASEPQIMRDIRFVQVAFYPVQYNPAQKRIRIYHDIAVNLTYGGEPINPKLNHSRYLSDGFYPIYKACFANFDQVFNATEVRRGGYVIICKPALVDSVKAVAAWKHQKGYSVRIVPTTEIYSSGNPTNAQIFAYLQDAYRTWEVPPEYIMIVGDLDGTYMVNDYPYNSYASDHHYACVDGSDYIADIFVARMSVDNMAEARRALSKIIKYEKYPYMTDAQHWIRGLSAAATYYESARLVTLWVRQLLMQNGFARVDTSFGDWDDPYLPTYFNTGVSLIQYRGAGSSNGWAGPPWGISDLLTLQNNQKLGVMASLTCGTGDFSAECFGETWIRMGLNPDSLKGGPAFYGVTDWDTHTRWNNPIMIGYYFGIFNEGVYHFAAAAVRGKLQEWITFPRYRTPGSYVEQYFNTYNMLGDPELEMRTKIPIRLLVDHPDTIPFGPNHIQVSVTDTLGMPVEGAFVTLIKGIPDITEELFSVGKTDNSGEISLSFDALTAGRMTLTVSGRDLYPYQGNVEIVEANAAIGIDSTSINDDSVSPSQGNNDGLAAPGETIELSVWLKNYGGEQTVQDISARLESIDALAAVFDSIRTYGDLLPGELRQSPTPFVVQIGPYAINGGLVRLKLTSADQDNNSWVSEIGIPVIAPKFGVGRVIIAGNDTILSPGETAQMVLNLVNAGGIGVYGLTGTVTCDDDYAQIISASGSFGDIPVDSMGNNASSPMTISCDPAAFEGHRIDFTLHTIAQAGSKADIPFSVIVGHVSQNDPVGPNSYGYYMYDTRDSSYACLPTFDWVEIKPDSGGNGTRLNFGSEIDDKSVLVTLPFDMVYYGEPHRALIVCINGFVALDTFSMDSGRNYWANFFNWPIPDPGNAQGQISPFWDDLRINGSYYGVYTWFDSSNHQFYIEWLNMAHTNLTAYQTFQMVISDPAYNTSITGDSEIRFIYRDVNNRDSGENYASVGFESWDERSGLEYTHDNFYASGAATLADNLVILITTNTGRGGIKGHVELNNGGQNGGIRISASTGQYRITDESGDYWLREVPPEIVSLTAEGAGYFPAFVDSVDVDMNKTANGINLAPAPCPIPDNLTATDDLLDRVIINWRLLSNPDLAGYNVYRSRWQAGEYMRLNAELVTTNNYTDTTIADTVHHWYYVTAAFAGQNWTAESFGSGVDDGRRTAPVGIAENEQLLPMTFFLNQNYPNPFNPTTTISYGLPEDSHVTVEVYDIMGRRIESLVNQIQKAGYYHLTWTAKNLSSGIYFAKMEAGDKKYGIKLVLLK